MKLTYFLIALFLLLSPVLTFAAYNDVSLTTGTTLRVTVAGSVLDLTVASGNVQQVVVRDSSLSIDLAAGSSIDITSSSKITFGYTKNNAIANFACNSASSVLNLSLAGGQTTETVSVTPNTTTCSASTSGGGGSSSSSSSTTSSSSSSSSTSSSSASAPSTTTTSTTASTPAVVASAPAKTVAVAPVTAPVAVSTPIPIAVSTAQTISINSELNPGARNDEVMDLQKLLAKDPEIYPEGTVSGFYGPKTTAAVKKFQAKYGLPTVGRVGPATMAKINEVLGGQTVAPVTPSTTASAADQIQTQIQTIQSQIQALTSGTSASVEVSGSVMVNTELNPGTRNDEVMDLQKLLAKDPEIYPEGTVSGFYGPKTTAAVKKFQAKYGLSTVGRVGPAAMAKLNEVLGGQTVAPVVPQVPSYVPAPAATESSDTAKQIEDQIKAIQDQINTLTAPSAPVVPAKPVPVTTSTDDLTKQIEAQIKAIQDQIKALQ